MFRTDCQNWILRPGELHIVMAMLRTIGHFIDGSGIPESWVESGMYGPTTCKQIIDGTHVKRCVEAHITTLLTLFQLYLEPILLKNQERYEVADKISTDINNACKDKTNVKNAHEQSLNDIQTSGLLQALETYEQSSSFPMFSVTRQYMDMVIIMLKFIRAFHSGDWKLHLIRGVLQLLFRTRQTQLC